MVDYKKAWRTRLIQLIIVNVIFLAYGISVAVEDGNWVSGIGVWFCMSWFVGSFVAVFSKNGDRVTDLARSTFLTMFSGVFSAVTGGSSTFMIIVFIWSLMKCMFGMMIFSVIFLAVFFTYPFTTIRLFLKSRQ